jgi:UDP-2,4-diacetamido-2,4,6-trideoxy-beta-L-altropyranose hydrolase
MNFVIRTDASTRIGLGHLARCRTLATALRDQGAAVRFICRAHPGHQIAALRAEGFDVAALAAPPDQDAADGDYAAWLGVPQDQDAAETLAVLRDNGTPTTNNPQPPTIPQQSTTKNLQPPRVPRPDWLIVDHYGLDAAWEQALRPHVDRILVIDDLANRRHDGDLLLDQNYAPAGASRYQDLLPPGGRTLLGPAYALLRPEYAQHRQTLRSRDIQVRRVLVFFGGTDPHNLSGRALSALSDPALTHLAVDLVIGANHPQREALTVQAAARPGTRVHGPRPHLADLMAAADLAIGAGGATTWERCCLGLPSLVVSLADNQRPACAALAADGLIRYLGHADQVTAATLRAALVQAMRDPAGLRAQASVASATVDGQGTQRVIDALLAKPLNPPRSHAPRPAAS